MGDTGTRVDPAEAGAANGYEITATSSLPDMRLRTLKHGRTFALFDPHGDITPVPGRPDGLFHDDTRFLSGTD